MKFFFLTIWFLLILGTSSLFAQVKKETPLLIKDTLKSVKINPLAPTKAAFYSTIVPGLGQAYNKKYWKIPLVYAALGTGIYFISTNNSKYLEFRNAYKRRLEGYTDDNLRYLDDSRLIDGQRYYQRNRDLSILITAAIYILNIVDANVDAHLMQFNVNDKLTVKPEIYPSGFDYKQNVGLTLNYQF